MEQKVIELLTMKIHEILYGATCLALWASAKMPDSASDPAQLKALTVRDWSQISGEYQRHRHGMFPDGAGFKARSFEQRWLTRFDGRGFLVEPDHASWRWGLELVGVTGKARIGIEVNRMTYRWSAELDEWFVNDTHGLEHGFTLHTPREIKLAVRGGLRPRASGAGVEFLDASDTARIEYKDLVAWDANGRALPARMTVQDGLVTLAVEDEGARYPITIDPIAQQAYLKASNTGGGDRFGTSIGVSGDTVVVGAYEEDSNATGVNGSQADNSATNSGAAYVFVRSGSVWTQQAYLKASNTGADDDFGSAVAVSGDTVVVGALQEASNATGVNGNQADNSASASGAAYVYTGFATTVGVTVDSSPSGLIFTSSGSGCAPGAGYVTPQTLSWTSGASCSIAFGTPQIGPGSVQYNFLRWEDNSTNATRGITAPGTSATYTATFVPATGAQPISVGPSSGTAGRQLFNFVSRHASTANSILYTQFLFSKSGLSALNACYISYDPSGNVFYLLSDDMTQWYGLLGGSANTVGNAQCTIYGATSGSSKAGTDLTTNVDISFRSGFAGLKTIYQFTGDTSAGTSGWQSMGTWNDTGDASVVELSSLTPNSGTGASQVFTALVKDGDGATTIPFAQLVMNATLSGFNGCFIHYDRASNVFFLLNDVGTVFSGLVGGSAGQVSNSQCTLHGTGSGGTVNGSNLTITYNLDLSAGFAGLKKVFMQAVDNTGVIEVWHQMGTWTR